MENTYRTSFQIYLCEDLGIIDNIFAHVNYVRIDYQTVEINTQIKAEHSSRYISINGSEWLKVFYLQNNVAVSNYETFKSSAFTFPMELGVGMEGEFYMTFTAFKNDLLTSYYTSTKHFLNSQKLKIW